MSEIYKCRYDKKITPYGGIIPVIHTIRKYGVHHVIRKSFGKRKRKTKYQLDQLMLTYVYSMICGGQYLEDMTHYREKLKRILKHDIPTPDTVVRALKKFKTKSRVVKDTTQHGRTSTITYASINENPKMVDNLIKATKRIGALKEKRKYTLHMDAVFVPSYSQGALHKPAGLNGEITLNTKTGFNCMVSMINELVVNISLRNGDSSPKLKLLESLKDTIMHLKNSNIEVGRIIMDGAAFVKEVMSYIEENSMKFIFRFNYNQSWAGFANQLNGCNNWRKTEIETGRQFWDCEVGSFAHTMSWRKKEPLPKTYRIVAIRIPTWETIKKIKTPEEIAAIIKHQQKMQSFRDDKKLKIDGSKYNDKHWKEIDGYLYKFVITNDFKGNPEDIMVAYNKRGNAERKFGFMKRDFGWIVPPCSKMEENTVFMIAASMSNNLYRGVLAVFKKVLPGLRLNMRRRTFTKIFITVCCELINGVYEFDWPAFDYEKIP
jgi:hypothetical protein